jgi:hypothetical protein
MILDLRFPDQTMLFPVLILSLLTVLIATEPAERA